MRFVYANRSVRSGADGPQHKLRNIPHLPCGVTCDTTITFGFVRSTAPERGSHHFKYTYPGWNGFLSYQIRRGGEAKTYRVRQLMKTVASLNLTIERE